MGKKSIALNWWQRESLEAHRQKVIWVKTRNHSN